jgi:YVTN family beta-propeller protein
LHAQFADVANEGDNTVSGYTINPVSPDGVHAYVTNAGAKSVSVIDTTAGPPRVVATVGVGAIPVHVSISPDGVHAYVTNAGSDSVSVIDTTTNAVTVTVPVGVRPVNAAIF